MRFGGPLMNFKAFWFICSVAGVAIAALAAPASAHHSFAMFDAANPMTMTGTVQEFEWTNPHSWLQVMVADDAGKIVEYSLEMSSPGRMALNGWTPRTVVPGDAVTVTLHPLRDGTPGGQFITIKLPDGSVMVY